jgi:hypothetical protein
MNTSNFNHGKSKKETVGNIEVRAISLGSNNGEPLMTHPDQNGPILT